MALIKETSNGKGYIRIWDDAAKKEPEEIQEIIDRVSKTVIDYYRRQTA